jgi:hypothetical protein
LPFLIDVGEFVVRFQTTIALTKNGAVRLSGPIMLDVDGTNIEKDKLFVPVEHIENDETSVPVEHIENGKSSFSVEHIEKDKPSVSVEQNRSERPSPTQATLQAPATKAPVMTAMVTKVTVQATVTKATVQAIGTVSEDDEDDSIWLNQLAAAYD